MQEANVIRYYHEFVEKTKMAFNAREHLRLATMALKDRENEIIASTPAKDLGANDKERAARVWALTEEEWHECKEADLASKKADHELEIARLEVECLQWQIRACEAALSALVGESIERRIHPRQKALIDGGGLGK